MTAKIIKSTQQTLKEAHQKLVFSLIHKSSPISRADIKKATGLSATTVSSLVEELIEKGFVREGGAKDSSTSGRKGISLKIAPYGGYFAVIAVSEHHIGLRIYDLCLRVVAKQNIRRAQPLRLPEQISALISDNMPVGPGHLLGITAGLSAITDNNANNVPSAATGPDSADNITDRLTHDFPGARVCLCSRSGLAAYAEKEFGNTGCENIISVNISGNISAAMVTGGALYTGSHGMACGFGHISVDHNGARCRCGGRGCLETLVSVPAIEKKASDLLQRRVCIKDLPSLAQAEEILDDTAKILAFGINNLINTVDPQTVIISGGIKALGDRFIENVRSYINRMSLPGRDVTVTYSSLDPEAEFTGGAKYIFDTVFAE